MPGEQQDGTEPVPAGANAALFGAVAFFWGAAGVCWRARPDGKLDEIPPEQVPPRTW